MRLLFLSNFYPPYILGGFEQLCQEVVQGLQERGHQVLVLTSRYRIDQGKPDESNVIRSLHLQADTERYRPLNFFLKRPRQEKSNAVELEKALESFSPDIVVIWSMWNLSPNLPFWAEQWMPGRVAYYISSLWPQDPDIHKQYWMAPARRRFTEFVKQPLRTNALSQLASADYPPGLRFLNTKCSSNYVRDTLVNSGKLPENSSVLFLGIDPEPFLRDHKGYQINSNNFKLIYFGSLLPQKGVHTAIEALGLLEERGCCDLIDLTIIGAGLPNYERHLRELVINYGLEDKVHFTGRIPRSEIPHWLGKFDAFLFTSIGPEAMARTVMEAMAAGLLVIGTQVGGQAEMLFDRENSLTFEPEDANGLANQILISLNDPDLRYQLAESGQNDVLNKFNLNRMVDDVEDWLQEIVV